MLIRFITMIMLVAATSSASAQEAELVSVAPGVYICGNTATTLAVVTEDGVVVIDPVNPGQAAAMDAALSAVTEPFWSKPRRREYCFLALKDH